MHIISASRRTDIPAFYMPWFVNRLEAGSATYPNPFGNKVYTVSLRPDDVHSIVFWSKNYCPFLKHIDELERRGYRFYCHYTITGAPRSLEPHVPRWEEAVAVFKALADRTSPRHVQWRYDPIMFTDDLDAGMYLIRFREIATALAGYTQRCYFSFATFYNKVDRRLEKEGIHPVDPPLEAKQELVSAMAEIGADCGITLYSCCQDILVDGRVKKAHCVDGDLLAELFPDRPLVRQHRPTRQECGCTVSRDIGMYDSCPYGCVYCYANRNQELALKRLRSHNPETERLIGEP